MGKLPDTNTSTRPWVWDWTPDRGVENFVTFCRNGKRLADMLSPDLSEQYSVMLSTFWKSGVHLAEYDLRKALPGWMRKRIEEEETRLLEREALIKPPNYDFLVQLHQLFHSIYSRPLKIQGSDKYALKPRIIYRFFSSANGRLTTSPDSFPILNIPKPERDCVKPYNHMFVELDINAADIRTLLALEGIRQPTLDVHTWLIEKVFKTNLERSEGKQRFFSWLFSGRSDECLDSLFDREGVVRKYATENTVTNPYGRTFAVQNPKNRLQYLIASTTMDIVARQTLKLHEFLKGKKTFVAAIIHDSVLLDFHESDVPSLKSMLRLFTETPHGVFLTNVGYGEHFGAVVKKHVFP